MCPRTCAHVLGLCKLSTPPGTDYKTSVLQKSVANIPKNRVHVFAINEASKKNQRTANQTK
jgi:hypothetical protein